MDWLSTDPSRPGVIAFGHEASGIVAIGQFACGVVAIGQIARGVIAIGQVAIGVFAIGQVTLGVLYGVGAIGVAVRGFGVVLEILPAFRIERFVRPSPLPRTVPLDALRSGRAARGWVLARIDQGRLVAGGALLELVPTATLHAQLADAAREGHTHACVAVEVEDRAQPPQGGGYRDAAPRERVLVGIEMRSWREPPLRVRLEGPLTGPLGLALRALGLLALAGAFYFVVGVELLAMLGA